MKHNIHSLLPDPLPLDKIPDYPTNKLIIAEGGEITYRLDPKCKFGDGKQIIIHEVKAEPGEILRDVDLRLKVDNIDNLLFRGEVTRDCNTSERFQAMQMTYCRSDILYFANTFCWTFIPGMDPVPFVTYPFQDDILTWCLYLVKYQHSGLIEKSRDMGMSWVLQIVIGYLVVFFPRYVAYELSMTESEVDDRSPDSLLGKLRMLLEFLPIWMRAGWAEYGEGIDKKMDIRFPDTKSKVAGELTGGKAGRSGRGKIALYDEFAFVENATETIAAGSSLTNCKIYLSTVNGMGNEFARIAHNPGTNKKSLHWSVHPLKSNEWAIKERGRTEYTEELWNQEHEINYEGSTKGRVYPQFKSRKFDEWDWVHAQEGSFYEFDPAYEVYIGMDFGISQPNSVVYAHLKQCPMGYENKFGNCLVIFDEDEEVNQPVAPTPGLKTSLFEMVTQKGYRIKYIVGDPYSSGRRDSITFKTIKDYFMENGVPMYGDRAGWEKPINEVRKRLEVPAGLAVNKHKAPWTTECMQNWSFPVDKQSVPIPDAPPKHDPYSHINTALYYLIDYMFGSYKPRTYKRQDWDFTVVKSARL